MILIIDAACKYIVKSGRARPPFSFVLTRISLFIRDGFWDQGAKIWTVVEYGVERRVWSLGSHPYLRGENDDSCGINLDGKVYGGGTGRINIMSSVFEKLSFGKWFDVHTDMSVSRLVMCKEIGGVS